MAQTIKKAGGASLADLVTMTVYVTDARYLERFAEIRRELFKDESYPASTFLAVAGLPLPGAVVEIQGTAVIG
jgi:2-iminobutanoate/2-iminopropanoate deaminase